MTTEGSIPSDLPGKRLITIPDVCKRYKLKKSYVYKLTSRRLLPHYKPLGKIIYFRADEIEEFLLSNRISTQAEIQAEAKAMLANDKKKGA